MEKSCYILMFCQDELAQGIINHLVMKLYQVTDTDMGNNEEEFVFKKNLYTLEEWALNLGPF